MIKGVTRVVGKIVEFKPKKHREYIPGQMILRVKEAAVGPRVAGVGPRFTAAHAKSLPQAVAGPLDYLRNTAGLKRVTPLFSTRQDQLRRAGVSSVERHRLAVLSSVADSVNEDLRGFTLVEVDPKKVTPALARHLQASEAVEIAEPMPARWLAAATADPMENLQWGLRAIKWFDADIPAAGNLKVGVMDTGIDRMHPDLSAIPLDYRHHGLSARDLIGHGTHVSGIITATVNNEVGIAGIAQCSLVMWKIFPDQPDSDSEFYVDGERYLQALAEARNAGVRVVNLSIGGTARSQTEQLLFRRLEQAGVVVAAAMGNEYQEGNPIEYPAAYDTVFAVGAVAENGRRAVFSNTGKHIGLVAPGANILSTLPMKASPYLDETEYAAWSGTSMATPHVSGAAALLAAKHPELVPVEIKKKLRETAQKLPIMKKSWTREYGSGLLDLKRALS